MGFFAFYALVLLLLGTPANADGELRAEDFLALAESLKQLAHGLVNPPIRCQPKVTTGSNTQVCQIDPGAQVIQVPMVHYRPELEADPHLVLVAAESQLNIFQFLNSHPQAEVFEEGSLGDDTWKGRFFNKYFADGDHECLDDILRATFPKGMPEKPENLSLAQQKLLVFCGGSRMAEVFGQLKQIHQGESLWLNLKVNSMIDSAGPGVTPDQVALDPKNRAQFFDDREKFMVEQVRDYRKEHPSAQVVILYGTEHDFSKYFTDVKYSRATGCTSRFDQVVGTPPSLNGGILLGP